MFQWKQSFAAWLAILAMVQGRKLQEGDDRVRTDLVRLIPFDVQIAMTGALEDVNVYALTDIVTDWMTDSFVSKSLNQALINNATRFSSLGLELRARRVLQEEDNSGSIATTSSIQLFTAQYDGVSLWERTGSATPPMNQEVVELILRATFLEDNDLLAMLRDAEPFTGLGDTVVDVRAYVASVSTESSSGGNADNLEIIIIIAIVVACLAFGLLMFAVVWAWRTDQSKSQEVYKGDRHIPRIDVPTGSEESDYNDKSPTGMTPPAAVDPEPSPAARPPKEIASSPNEYPESVISEDISTSLTAYYRSGVAGYSNAGGTRGSSGARELNDAASMSSMDSYGYSLDGYAPSLGPAPQGYPVGPFNGMIKNPDSDYSEDEEGTFSTQDGDEQ